MIRRLAHQFSRNSYRNNIATAVTVSALNQVVSSGSNFLLGLYLVRALSPRDFGLFGIGFAASLFYAGIGNALFLVQMVVHTPDRLPEERLAFSARMFLLTAIFCAVTLLASLLGFLAITPFTIDTQSASYGLAIVIVSVTYLVRDFFVRHAFNVRRERWALLINSAVPISMLVIFLVHHLIPFPMTATCALIIYGLANFVGGICGWLLANLRFDGITLASLIAEMKRIQRGAYWAAFTTVLESLQSQSHIIMTAWMVGPPGVANMNASRLLIVPAMMFMPTVAQVAMPRLASVGLQDSRKISLMGVGLGGVGLGISVLYCSVLLVGYVPIATLMLKHEYSDLFFITVLWAVYACVFSVKLGVEIGLQVLRRFSQLAIVRSITVVASLPITYLLTVNYGVPGALIGLIAGELILLSAFTIMSMAVSNPSEKRL